uniref:ATP-binding protein DrrA1-3 family domain-containing protein n=1 Tax=Amphritea sp. TaxID=1872502 RepID=UPI003D0A89B4
HYIEEAEEMADRIGVIRKGKILLVEEKQALMDKLGSKLLSIRLQQPVSEVPEALAEFSLQLDADGDTVSYRYDSRQEGDSIARLLRKLTEQGLEIRDLNSSESSLEEIFVSLVHEQEQ